MKSSYSLATIALFTSSTSAFVPSRQTFSSSSPVSMAGFGAASSGGGGGMSKKKNGKTSKPTKNNNSPIFKPKSQWDRYISLKKATSVRVAARVANDGQDVGEWFEIGSVKSEGDEFTEAAVAFQRGIIAEHAKRLHPLQFLPKDKVDWAYDSGEDWVLTDKSVVSSAPAGLEKQIGFEGKPDPATGFYIGGRLADNYDDSKSSKKFSVMKELQIVS